MQKAKAASVAIMVGMMAAATPAQAVTVYTDAAAFAAATTAPGTDTYAGFDISGETTSPLTRSAGTYSYTASVTDPHDGNDVAFFGAGSTANPWLAADAALSSVVFSGFSSAVTAIGGNFFDSDIAGAFKAGNITLSFTDAAGTVTRTIVNATTSSFLGFVSDDPITSLTVTAVQPATAGEGGAYAWATADNLTLAENATVSAAPEPGTWMMMILGFGLVGGVLRAAHRRSEAAFTRKVRVLAAG